jgi:hypothetical protein
VVDCVGLHDVSVVCACLVCACLVWCTMCGCVCRVGLCPSACADNVADIQML